MQKDDGKVRRKFTKIKTNKSYETNAKAKMNQC